MTFVLDKEFYESIYCFSQLLITGGHRVGTFFSLTSVINEYIGIFVMGIFLLMVSYYATSPSYKIAKEDGFFHGIYFFIFYLIEFSIPITLFLAIPYLLENHFALKELANWIRWFEIFVAGVIYFKLRKHAETRGLYSFLGHYALLLFAWFIDRWVGIIFIALPLLFVYYHVMSRIAFEIMPASNPDDKKEKKSKFRVFLSYTWGLQQPLWKALSNTAKESEKRIDGAPSFIKFDGMVWTYPHQAIGITDGPKFSVDGPGLVFIGKDKQPFDIVDLRDITRMSTIKAISRDGISFDVTVTVVFRVDYEAWTKEQHQKLRRENTLLREGKELDKNLGGTFPYSQARARSVLSYRSRKTTANGEEIERWDDHVVGMSEQAAREVLAERSIEDLWKARENENSGAAEEITREMKALIKDSLHIHGIELITAKATKFLFKNDNLDEKLEDEVSEQQLATWSVEWERQCSMTLADGQAESERIQQEARAYAHSVLLTAIAEGLQQARAIHPNLPRYVIAMRFIGALEEVIEQQPETDEKEVLEARASLRNLKAHYISASGKE
jgi:hypothetical protein